MKLGQQLKIKQNQSLIMTPQLQQAIKLLQLTNIELSEFIEQQNTKQFKDVEKFFTTMPKLSHTVKVKNPKTKKESEITLSGLNDFFGQPFHMLVQRIITMLIFL